MPRTFRIAVRRSFAAAAAAALIAVGTSAAAAPSQDEIDSAFENAKQLLREAASARAELDTISGQVQALAEQMARQEGKVEQITTELARTEQRAADLQAEYDRVAARLNDRAAQAFMAGQADSIGFLLGSDSMSDLSDRLEFVDAVAQGDADLGNQVTNARTLMEAEAARLRTLREAEVAALGEIKAAEVKVQAQMQRQAELVAEIEAKTAAAKKYAQKLSQERTDYLDSLLPPTVDGGASAGPLPPGASSVFRYCPVDAPKVVTDSFGAPRYVGGYHPHKGDDIMAPSGTPIRAPFDGVARDATNEIGGIAVIVQGASGYVYNAHMSRMGSLGTVQAGDIVGYVGMTGASGAGVNHNHFEYHPNVIPSSWPTSAYGLAIIDDAINPYPLLSQVC